MMIPWHFFQCYIEVDILALYQNTPTIIGWIASTFMVSRRWTVITLLHWCFQLSCHNKLLAFSISKNNRYTKQNISCHVQITCLSVHSNVERRRYGWWGLNWQHDPTRDHWWGRRCFNIFILASIWDWDQIPARHSQQPQLYLLLISKR